MLSQQKFVSWHSFVYRQEVPTHDVPLSCKVRQHKLADDYLGNKLIRRSYVEESSKSLFSSISN